MGRVANFAERSVVIVAESLDFIEESTYSIRRMLGLTALGFMAVGTGVEVNSHPVEMVGGGTILAGGMMVMAEILARGSAAMENAQQANVAHREQETMEGSNNGTA